VNFEHFVDLLVGVVTAAVGWLAVQWNRLRSDVNQLKTESAVLQSQYNALPDSLKEIKDEIKGLRGDFHDEMRRLHNRVDSKADR
jgi:predicted  nucleic acid-binding Zn-ribbon protein